jgi:RNA polymerase sigma-70 factor (ECF subfamily)
VENEPGGCASLDEQTLLRQAQSGDREALGSLLMPHQTACYALALRLTSCATEAEDVCQDAFIRAARDISIATPIRNFRSWLFKLVVHAHGHRCQSACSRRQRERAWGMTQSVKFDAIHEQNKAEFRELLNAGLEKLDTSRRLPIVLHYEQGMSHREVSEVLNMPEGTVKTNIHRGLDDLRGFMARAGVSCAAPLLVVSLQQTSSASAPAGLTAFIKTLSAAGAAQTGAAAVTAVTLSLGWKAVAGLSLAALASFGGMQGWKHWHPAAAASGQTPVETADEKPIVTDATTVTLTPGGDAYRAFETLARMGGPKVIRLNQMRLLKMPQALRFKPIEGRKFIEAVASASNLKVVWAQDDKTAILQQGATNDALDRVLTGLQSADPETRRHAAWLARWTEDVRALKPLLHSAADAEDAVGFRAVESLTALGVEAAALFGDEKILPLIEKALANPDSLVRRNASFMLQCVRDEKTLPLIEKALADKDAKVRANAFAALGRAGGERDMPLIEKLLANAGKDYDTLCNAATALGRVGGGKALALLEKMLETALRDPGTKNEIKIYNVSQKRAPTSCDVWFDTITNALGAIGSDKAVDLLEKIANSSPILASLSSPEALRVLEKRLSSPNAPVRSDAAYALLNLAREATAIPLLSKALDIPDPSNRPTAWALMQLAEMEEVMPLLEKLLSKPNKVTREQAIVALGFSRNEHAVDMLEKMLADSDATIRELALSSLANIGNSKALTLIKKENASISPNIRFLSIAASSSKCVDAEKALPSLEQAIDGAEYADRGSDDYSARILAVQALSIVSGLGSDRVLTLYEKILFGRGRSMLPLRDFSSLDRDKARALLKKVLAHPDAFIRTNALYTMLYVDGDMALSLLEKASSDPDFQVRRTVLCLMDKFDGDQALSIIERGLEDNDMSMRIFAADKLGFQHGAKALNLIEKSLASPYEEEHGYAVQVLANRGGEKARQLLLKHLPDENHRAAIARALRDQYPGDPDVLQALKDVKIPDQAQPAPQPAAPKPPRPPKPPPGDF